MQSGEVVFMDIQSLVQLSLNEAPDQKTPFFTAFHGSFLIHLPSNPEYKSHAVSFLEVTSVFVTIPVP